MTIFYSRCWLCSAKALSSINLCVNCYNKLPWLESFCQYCAQALPMTDSKYCAHCLTKPPAFHHIFSPCRYQSPINYLIKRLKFSHQLYYAKLLADLLLTQCSYQTTADVIIPIPLHKHRFAQRGFNQSLEIAKHVSRQLNIPIDDQSIIRHKATLAQAELAAHQRKKNIHQAFTCLKRALAYKSVIVIDDVVTTTQTVREFARLLQAQGVKLIEIWSPARAHYDLPRIH